MAKVEMDYKEHVKSIDKNGKYKSVEIRYIVFEAADEDTALTAVLGVAAKELNDLPLDSIEIDERCGDQTFKINALYKTEDISSSGGGDDEDDDEDPTISFDCGGGSKHLLYSLAQKKVFGDKDPGGAIGWNGKTGDDCEITGVDIPTAQLRETYKDFAIIDDERLVKFFDGYYTVYEDLSPEEILTGISGLEKGSEDYNAIMEFVPFASEKDALSKMTAKALKMISVKY